jgi:hypothetical protein
MLLHRPCCTKEADEGSVTRWINAAHAASLPVLWAEAAAPAGTAAAAAAVERDQLLAAMALSAAATFASGSSTSSGNSSSSNNNGTTGSSGSSHGKQLQQLDAAAVALLAAAALPPLLPYGSSKKVSVSRFMPALLGSDCCHVLLHALAVAAEANPVTATAVTGTGVVSSSSVLPAVPGGSSNGVDAGDAASSCRVIVAAPQQASLAWQLLRMICAQCTQASRSAVTRSHMRSQQSSGSDSDGGTEQSTSSSAAAAAGASEKRHKPSSSLVQPQQVLRVVQAYAEHIPSVAPLVPRLLGSLHVLLCQAALVTQQQQTQQLQVASAANSSSSSYSMVIQLLHRVNSIPSLRGLAQKLSPLWESMSSQLAIGPQQQQQQVNVTAASSTHRRSSSSSSNGSSSSSGSGRSQGLAWQLPTCAYVVLSVALAVESGDVGPGGIDLPSSFDQLHDGVGELEGYQGELSIVLAAARMAAAALHVLLPALLGGTSSNSSSVYTHGQQQRQGEAAAAVPSHSGSSSSSSAKEAPIALQGVVEGSLATLQALVLLTRHLQAGLGASINSSSSLLSWSLADCKTPEEAAAAKAAQAAAAGLAAALDSRLCGLLEQVVSAWAAAESTCSEDACKLDVASPSAAYHLCSNSSSSSSNNSSGSAATSVQAALQHHLQQEIRCWAAVALAACYGQLGANSSQGQLLAAARQPGAIRADTELQLADGGAAIPVHAAVLAAGCPVLGKQLHQQQQQRIGVAGAQLHSELHTRSPLQGGKMTVKLSAAVDRAALQAALQYVYTGAAAIPEAGLAAQLTAAVASKPKQQQQQGCEVQELQEDGQQQLAGLGRLAKKLQLQLLAALCRQVTPSPGVQLQLLHPQLRSLLPQQLLLLEMAQCGGVTQQQQQQQSCEVQDQACHCRRGVSVEDGGSSRGCAVASEAGTAAGVIRSGSAELELMAATAAPAGALRHSSSNCSSDSFGREHCGHHLLCTDGDCHQPERGELDVKQSSNDSSTGIGGSAGSMPSAHSRSSAYLGMLARCMESDSTPAAVYVTIQQQQQQQQLDGSSVVVTGAAAPVVQAAADVGYADVMLAAPAVLQTSGTQQQQQQQQQVLALLPAHQVLLSGCGYFEALFSQRWHRSGWQEPWQDSSSSSASSSSIHDAAADDSNLEIGSHSSSNSNEVQTMRRLQVVLVPEADIHIAAALQHWLYTGELQIALQPHAAGSYCGTRGHSSHQQQLQEVSVTQQQQLQEVSVTQQQQQRDGVTQQQQQQQQQPQLVQLNGCSPACHACRTLLRLWRCADLLLLPALQEQSLAALEAAVAQLLPCACCVVLLQDCCLLGVAPAADCAITGLLARSGEWYNCRQRKW